MSPGAWVRVDLDLVEQVGLDAALVYGLIAYRCQPTGVWQATRDQMVAETRLTEHRVRRALEVLRDAGMVESRRADRFRATLTWRVSPGHAEKEDSTITRVGEPPSREGHISPPPEMEDSTTSLSTQKVKKSPPPPRGRQQDQPDLFGAQVAPQGDAGEQEDPLAGFDAWWAVYPRKVAKGDARKAWRQVTRQTSPEVIQAGLVRQAGALAEAHDRGFCPYPATWLRAERWADEQQGSNVHPLRPDLGAEYDPAYAQTLPPPRTDPFAVGGRW